MNRDEMLAFIEKTSAEVAKMPAWKRGLLEASMKTMNDEPRKPITTKERAMKIEGVPEGWELLRIGPVTGGDWYIGISGRPTCCEYKNDSYSVESYAIVRKVERPKQYRPFANAEEFKPHRERWVRLASCDKGFWRFDSCTEDGAMGAKWKDLFKTYVFDDDGTPFGVEVSEAIRAPITRPAQSY